jgi:hypothetical protein
MRMVRILYLRKYYIGNRPPDVKRNQPGYFFSPAAFFVIFRAKA